MRFKNLLFHGLVALPVILGAAGCSDDDDWGSVDGKDPGLALAAEHLHTEAGRSIQVKGHLEDADGISTISLVCPELKLNKTIDIIDIYGEPLKEYDLDYAFKINNEETGDNFKINVTVTDVVGNRTAGDVLVTMDGDFAAPVFSAAPSAETTVLIKAKTNFRLKFTVTDNFGIDHVTVDMKGVPGFPITVDGNNRKEVSYEKVLDLPATAASYDLEIVAYDKADFEGKNRTTAINSVVSVSELPDFKDMYLADVATAADLNSDVFGVPMVCDHIAPYTYRARYFNTAAGTEICFIPQKTDFTPICFGPDKNDPGSLGDDPEEVGRIRLDKAGVYYEIILNTMTRAYSIKEYSVADAVSPIMHMTPGMAHLNQWSNWDNGGADADWREWFIGPITGGPGDCMRMEQDRNNPNIFTMEWQLNAGDKAHFVIHNYHGDGWWNYTTWRVDDGQDPSRCTYYGVPFDDNVNFKGNYGYFKFKYIDIPAEEFRFMYPNAGSFDFSKWGDEGYRKVFVPDNWADAPVAVSGKYKLVFDAHTERVKLIPMK